MQTIEMINGEEWLITTMESGAIVRELISQASVTPTLYVDISITDLDHTGTPGVKNDGVDTVNMQITLRTADENVLAVSESFRIILRDGDNKEYSVLKIAFVGGVSSFDFKTTGRSATVRVDENDLVIPGMDFDFTVRGDNKLFVYEDFTN